MSLPFDPRETGPWDIYRGGKAFVREHATVVVPSIALLVAGVVWLRPGGAVGLGDVPGWLRVFVAATGIIAALAYVPARRFIDFIYTREYVVLVELAPMEGDLSVHRLSPDRFSEIEVYDGNGEHQGRNYLTRLQTPAGLAYECKRYNSDANAALASWMAGESYKEIRASQKTLERIETDMAREADKFLDLRVNHATIIRKVYRRVINRQITQVEEMTVPDGELISETIDDVMGDLEPGREGSPADEAAVEESIPSDSPFEPAPDRDRNGHESTAPDEPEASTPEGGQDE